MKNLFIYTLFLIITTALLSCFFSGDEILERNKKTLASAYIGFQEVNEKYNAQNFEVKLLCQAQVSSAGSPNPIRIFTSVNGKLIVSCNAEKNDKTTGDMIYYKIENTGTVVDTLYLPQNEYYPEFMGDFMVFTNYDKAYYTTWPLNGDTTKQAFKILNANLNWSGDKINHAIKNAQKEGTYWFLKNVTDNGVFYRQFLFYQDKQWQLLWLKLPVYQSLDDNEEASRYQKDVFFTGEEDPYLPENVSFLHFHPLEKIEYSHNIGGGNPGFSVTNWRGKAFFKAKVAGKDFDFFVPNIAIENEKFDGNRDRFYRIAEPGYSSKNFRSSIYVSANGFAFYSSNYDSLYMIRIKDKQKIKQQN